MCSKRISEPEENLFAQIRIKRLPLPAREYRFFEYRQWRFDFAWPDPNIKLAVEVEGGTWVGGRHNRGKGFENDSEKYNFATLLGWRVLRYSSGMINDWKAVNDIKVALAGGFNVLNATPHAISKIINEGMGLRFK
jgi:very-short-patch-repair endonuclease